MNLHPRTRIEGDVAILTLTKGHEAIIDIEDVALVGQYAWCAGVKPHGVYAVRQARDSDGKKRTVRLHRAIMNAPENLYVDHINGNPLDNRRSNLRLATHAENTRNQRRSRANTSGFKGVHWHKGAAKWQAYISLDGKRRSLGYFQSPESAHEAYLRAAEELHGEFARAA